MGIIKQGILGGFNGTVGTVIGSSWKGLAYMRGKAQNIKNPRTEKQMAQRIKFATAQKFVKVITAYLQVGYRNYTEHKTAVNAAMSYTVRNCMTGTYPNFSIDSSKVMVSNGSLMPGRYCTVKVESNVATFGWEDNSGESLANMDDFAMPLVYNFTKGEAVFTTEDASRVDCKAELKLPSDWAGDQLSCYIAFASVQDSSVSNSVHVGDVESTSTGDDSSKGDSSKGDSSDSDSSTTNPDDGDDGAIE